MADITSIIEQIRSTLEANLPDPWEQGSGSSRSDFVFTNDVRITGNLPKILVKPDPTSIVRLTMGKTAYKTKFQGTINVMFFNKRAQKYYVTGTTLVNISEIDGNATSILVKTASSHGLVAGDVVFIASTTNYNGRYTVASVTDGTNYVITDSTHDLAKETFAIAPFGTSAKAITYEDLGSNTSRSLNQYFLKKIHDTLKLYRASVTDAKTVHYGSISNTDSDGELNFGFLPVVVSWIE